MAKKKKVIKESVKHEKLEKKQKQKVKKHLEGDIKTFEKEKREDKVLIKELKKKRK